jgi:hypothetical protein
MIEGVRLAGRGSFCDLLARERDGRMPPAIALSTVQVVEPLRPRM